MRLTTRLAALAALALAPAALGAVEVGDIAPRVRLQDQSGEWRDIGSDFGRRYVALTFYPKDDTKGCTLEAQSITAQLDALTDAGIAVYGVSVQDVASKQAFCEKHDLRHPLLADVDKEVSRAYGTLADSGMSKRVTVIVDPAGIVRVVDTQVKVASHGEDILSAVSELQEADAESALAELADEPTDVGDFEIRLPAEWEESEEQPDGVDGDAITWIDPELPEDLRFSLVVQRVERDPFTAEDVRETLPDDFALRVIEEVVIPGQNIIRLDGVDQQRRALSSIGWQRGDQRYWLSLAAPTDRADDAARLMARLAASIEWPEDAAE